MKTREDLPKEIATALQHLRKVVEDDSCREPQYRLERAVDALEVAVLKTLDQCSKET